MNSAVINYQHGAARLLSLLIAITTFVVIFAWPQLMVRADGQVQHNGLMFFMWSMAAGFVHGVGFVPRNRVVRVLLGPLVAWLLPLLIIAIMYLTR
ncbi:MAG: hypothetical protein GC149_00020 [Gammaproteobacteria bacterium]|nr:hypothetical protein [Gammaproteobacteria bacterium]